jgi:NAD(P)-dependent dehydrogenase (short-subunit alcohol dehydrogenase family)
VGDLRGKVALVTGASKNIGKGMALEVAASGALTYVTARTLGAGAHEDETLLRTVAEIEACGGRAVPVACDHTDDTSVERVFRQIADEQGRLDVVVNVASPSFSDMPGLPFWELPFDTIDRCLDVGPRSNFVTTALAARVMVPQRSGVIINISSHGAVQHLLSVPYAVGKGAIDKLTRDTAAELREHNVAVVSLWPGLVLTPRLLGNAERMDDGRLMIAGLDISFGESPQFNGKAVVSLAADPNIMARTGGSFWTGDLAREYGFTEEDGTLPPLQKGLRSFMDDADIPDYWKRIERFAANPA